MRASILIAILSSFLFCLTLGQDQQYCDESVSSQCPAQDPPVPVYFANPDDCHSFCECSNGEAFLVECDPNTLVWDPTVQVCDTTYPCDTSTFDIDDKKPEVKLPARVVQEDDSGTNGTCANSVSRQCPVPDPASPVYYPNPDDDTCATFCECSDGEAYLVNCPPGTLYNPDTSQCDSDYTCDDSGSSTENSVTRRL